MKFCDSDGSIAISDKQNTKLAAEYFNKVFNRDEEVDWEYIQSKKCKPTVDNLADSINFIKFSAVIDKLSWHKAPGINGVSPNMIKALNNDNMVVLFKFTQD